MIGSATLLCALVVGWEPGEIDFATGVLPWLTKAGCNAGACHGAAAGRGGMALSLWGSDPDQDYRTIVEAFEGRRIDRNRPAQSLILLKPTGQIDHGGDVALPQDSAGAQILEKWIASGATRGQPKILESFRPIASRTLFHQIGEQATLQGEAHWKDGTKTVVTEVMVVTATDTSAVEIIESETGFNIQIKRPGRHGVLVRYLDQVVPLVFDLPWKNHMIGRLGPAPASPIDREIGQTLDRLRIPTSEPATDGEFLRRVKLDLTGTLPTPEEIDAFTGKASPQKRAALVDNLLESPEFADFWTLKIAKLLRLQSQPGDSATMASADRWIRKSLQEGVSWDEMTQRLLLDTGDSHEVGSLAFARLAPDPKTHAEAVARAFMGVRIGCAQCHNHPLDRWTRTDYYGMAAIFARLERSRYIRVKKEGAVTDPQTGQAAIPRVPGGKTVASETDPRQGFVDWLLEPENPYFARAQANWIWSQLFGQGLVEPWDDLRLTNPPSHPQLLDSLAKRFRELGYRHKPFLREILVSETYGRSSKRVSGQPEDDRYLARFPYRRLDPEVIADAMATVLDLQDPSASKTVLARSISLTDGSQTTPLLKALGRCAVGPGCTPRDEPGLAAQLGLLNGKWLNEPLHSRDGRLARMLNRGATNQEIVETFYLLTLSRHPTPAERSHWIKALDEGPADQRFNRCADFCWALLNSREFLGNS